MAAYARLPLRFEVNQGQADPKVRFLSRGEGYALLLTRDEAILSLGVSKAGSLASSGAALRHTSRTPAAALRMKIEGASPVAFIHGTDELPGKSNYFIGNDPAKWRTGVPNYARVRYQDVYPGIDLVYYGNQRQLEYDFVVSSGADPQAIDLRVEGADRASLNTDGDLVLEAQGGRFVYHQPTIYQATNGARTRIPGGYVLGKVEASGAREVGFRVGPYDHSRALVIDPSLSYSTYLGGSKDDFANAIAVDAKGDAYITGDTLSTNFPTLNAEQSACSSCSVNSVDAFVTKINASGSALVYSTYLGGLASDQGNAIAVDASGDAYVTGNTASTNFPITSGAFQQASGGLADAFVTKLSP
ncbi:MAG TPA: SBBP repeat-containing protein, partial [Terriglobia bacterium]|nr:SBBP repeat-containing protein [Terriglobia bacterium]